MFQESADEHASNEAVDDPIDRGLRALGRSGAAGVAAGLLVGGIGGRAVMRISAIAADSDGLLTEGGNRVGDITVAGTIVLFIFGGALPGAFGGMVLFTIDPWLPRRPALRALSHAVVFPVMVGATIVAAENRDFLFLDPPELNIAMFLLLFAAFGAVAVVIDVKLDSVMPTSPKRHPPSGPRYEATIFAAPAVVVALLLLADTKPLEAMFLVLVGAATSIHLGQVSVKASPAHSRRLRVLGTGAVLGACLAGAFSLASEIERIV